LAVIILVSGGIGEKGKTVNAGKGKKKRASTDYTDFAEQTAESRRQSRYVF
jgi:hypothetical protein